MSATDEAVETKIVRDARIDEIGLSDELKKLFADPRRDAVKASMLLKQAERAEGDLFDALLVTGGVTRSVEAKKLFALIKKGEISEAQFLSAVTVKMAALGEFLTGIQIDRLCEEKPTASTLRITRKKGVALALLDVITRINAAVKG